MDADIEVVDKDKAPKLRYEGAYTHYRIGILYPNSIPQIIDVFRNKAIFQHGVPEPDILKHSEWLSLQHGDSYVATYLSLTYYDAFNVRHRETMCIWQSYVSDDPKHITAKGAGGSVGTAGFKAKKCTDYNNADNN